MLGCACAFLLLDFEQPLKSSTTISASTAVAAAVAAPPIIRARLVELFTIGLALKDFRSAMFVSPPPPWGSTHCYGTEAATCKTADSMRVRTRPHGRGSWRSQHDVCFETQKCFSVQNASACSLRVLT